GGQAGDTGVIEAEGKVIAVADTQKENNLTVHIVSEPPVDTTVTFMARVDAGKRRASANNHTATHLLQAALRRVLGDHVEQKGSLVTAEYLRFDFSHFQKVSDEDIRKVEQDVNAAIRRNLPLEEVRYCPIEKAKEAGAMMLFGEKYGETVRVIRFGDSIELCGGIHTSATGNIGLFKITSESAISAGVRRIEAVTGEGADAYVYGMEAMLEEVKNFLNTPAVLQGVRKLVEENSELTRRLDDARKQRAASAREEFSKMIEENPDGFHYLVRQVDLLPELIKDIAFAMRREFPKLILVVGSVIDEKPMLTVMLGDEVVARGVNAGNIVREAAKEINGGGGGQPFFATAGGKTPGGIEAAILKAETLIKAQIAKG
ncbi:MAG: alanine--tRNA ligase, partial [Rikenellaceae bacterium]|nr:alanine--tRNA ligase [Rikenellaceae bacterium]